MVQASKSLSMSVCMTTDEKSSRSRRFKCSGNEYKWKIAGNGQDLFVSEYHDCHALVNVEPLFSVSIAKINMLPFGPPRRCRSRLRRVVLLFSNGL